MAGRSATISKDAIDQDFHDGQRSANVINLVNAFRIGQSVTELPEEPWHTFVMLGKSMSGKTSQAKVLLGDNCLTIGDLKPFNEKLQYGEICEANEKLSLRVVDLPSFPTESDNSAEQIIDNWACFNAEFMECVKLSKITGVSAFLVVINLDECFEAKSVDKLFDILKYKFGGPCFLDYTFLLFTHCDKVRNVSERIARSNDLQRLLSMLSNRSLIFDRSFENKSDLEIYRNDCIKKILDNLRHKSGFDLFHVIVPSVTETSEELNEVVKQLKEYKKKTAADYDTYKSNSNERLRRQFKDAFQFKLRTDQSSDYTITFHEEAKSIRSKCAQLESSFLNSLESCCLKKYQKDGESKCPRLVLISGGIYSDKAVSDRMAPHATAVINAIGHLITIIRKMRDNKKSDTELAEIDNKFDDLNKNWLAFEEHINCIQLSIEEMRKSNKDFIGDLVDEMRDKYPDVKNAFRRLCIENLVGSFIMVPDATDETQISRTSECTTIVLLGPTGSGKSSTGNMLFGEKIFATGSGQRAVTKVAEAIKRVVDTGNCEFQLQVIDMPGFEDVDSSSVDKKIAEVKNNIDKHEKASVFGSHRAGLVKEKLKLMEERDKERNEFVLKEATSCLNYCPNDGVSAFFLVVDMVARHSPGVSRMYTQLREAFSGKHFIKNSFMMFTNVDRIDVSIEEYLKTKISDDVRALLDSFDNRYICVNCTSLADPKKVDEVKRWRDDTFNKVFARLEVCKPYGRYDFRVAALEEKMSTLETTFDALIDAKMEADEKIKGSWNNYSRHRLNVIKASVISSGVGLTVGLPLSIAGVALAVPTMGVSLVLTVVGASISVATSAASVGASAVDISKKKNMKQQNDNLKTIFIETTKQFFVICEALERDFVVILGESLIEASIPKEEVNNESSRGHKNIITLASTIAQFLSSGCRIGLQLAPKVSSRTIEIIGLTGLRAVPIVGAISGAVFDFATILQMVRKQNNTSVMFTDTVQPEIDFIDEILNDVYAHFDRIMTACRIFCEDPYAFIDELRDVMKKFDICHICYGMFNNLSYCPVNKKHGFCMEPCIRSCYETQKKQQREDPRQIGPPSCPVCREIWPVECSTDLFPYGSCNSL